MVPAMHASQIHKKVKKIIIIIKKPFKNLKVCEIITFGEQSLDLFFISLGLLTGSCILDAFSFSC